MRSEEVEEAIKYYTECNNNDLERFEYFSDLGKVDVKRMKTLLSYISELEEKVEEYNKQLDLDYVDNNFVSKAKIKELKEIYERKCGILKPNCTRIECYEMGKKFR